MKPNRTRALVWWILIILYIAAIVIVVRSFL